MVLDSLGFPVKEGDTVIFTPLSVGIVYKFGKGGDLVVSIASGHKVIVPPQHAVSIYPMTELVDKPSVGSDVVYLTLRTKFAQAKVVNVTLSLCHVLANSGYGSLTRSTDEVYVIDERIKYVEENYPELML